MKTNKRGFTLAEILIALGILAIGMSMVAAIFPAAMVLNRQSQNSTLGTIICENGLVMTEMVLTADLVDSEKLEIYADRNHGDLLSATQQLYPVDPENLDKVRTGFVVMARQIRGDKVPPGVFQIITVAYRVRKPGNTAELFATNCTVNGRNVSGATKLRIGSPLISRKNGGYAYIDSINQSGTAGTLDIKSGQTRDMPGENGYYVLIEKENGETINRRSPAIGIMSKMTGLNLNTAQPVAE